MLVIYGKKWNGRVAAAMYTGPVKAVLQYAWPREKKHLMLEDNDPTGFKSGLGETAKNAARIKAFVIPKRSPDLSVLDYAIWEFITRRMRAQEHKFSLSKRETRDAYIERLRRAAMSIPKKSIGKAIASMKSRCELLHRARGGHFEKGGH